MSSFSLGQLAWPRGNFGHNPNSKPTATEEGLDCNARVSVTDHGTDAHGDF